MSYAIVVEWEDGTVDVNGPYPADIDLEALHHICWAIALECEGESEADELTDMTPRNLQGGNLAWWRVRADADESIDVYVKAMGQPMDPAVRADLDPDTKRQTLDQLKRWATMPEDERDYELIRGLYFSLETTASLSNETTLTAGWWEAEMTKLQEKGLVVRYPAPGQLAHCWDLTQDGIDLIARFEPEAISDERRQPTKEQS